MPNIDQSDRNTDGIGDLCADDDNDGILGYMDNCICISNSDQDDINNNNIGDACEFDKDSDGIYDSIDNCINIINPDQLDTDKDGIGDVCDDYDNRFIESNKHFFSIFIIFISVVFIGLIIFMISKMKSKK